MITVIVDSGWSKYSHKHLYNAKSGLGIIIGKETGKISYLGVRNKYCLVATKLQRAPYLHTLASSIGISLHQQWKMTSSRRDLSNQKSSMAYATPSS